VSLERIPSLDAMLLSLLSIKLEPSQINTVSLDSLSEMFRDDNTARYPDIYQHAKLGWKSSLSGGSICIAILGIGIGLF